jgi:hypothetical protein
MKNKLLFVITLIGLGSQTLLSQDIKKEAQKAADVINNITKPDTVKRWTFGGLVNITFTQASFTNWAAGGQNSEGLTSILSLHANYKYEKIIWNNSVDLGYGFQKLGTALLQKTTDQIAINTNAGYEVFDHEYAGLLANFQTQFAPGYQFPANDSMLLSQFMAPAYLVLAAGLTYNPNKTLNIFLSPATARLTFVENQILANQGAFGVQPGKNEYTAFGAYFRGNYSNEIMKNVNLTTNIELFSNYLKDPQNIVVNWTLFLQFKVNKYISATFNTQLIYDNTVLIPIYKNVDGINTLVGKGPRTQFKEVLGIGFAYNF